MSQAAHVLFEMVSYSTPLIHSDMLNMIGASKGFYCVGAMQYRFGTLLFNEKSAQHKETKHHTHDPFRLVDQYIKFSNRE